MGPALPNRCSVVFNRNRRTPREHGIHVVRTDGGLIVQPVAWRGWKLASDNPAVAPEPWPTNAETIGEVARVA